MQRAVDVKAIVGTGKLILICPIRDGLPRNIEEQISRLHINFLAFINLKWMLYDDFLAYHKYTKGLLI